MNSGKTLKYMRRATAIAMGGSTLALFLDIRHSLPAGMQFLAEMQIAPLIVAGAIGGLLAMLLLTMLLGRLYCSVICPLGILQDVVLRLKKWWLTARGKRKALRMKYGKPLNILRYGVLASVAAPYVFGMTLPLLVTDPYSNFGRIATGIFRPATVWLNNLAASALNAAGNYSIYAVQNLDTGVMVTVAAAVALATLTAMTLMRGRLWCNTICPVGALLGFVSRFAIFRIRIDSAGCNSCGQCEAACKASCIDPATKSVDASRCVTCFNCLGVCKREAVSFASVQRRAASDARIRPVTAMSAPDTCKPYGRNGEELSAEGLARRDFLKTALMGAAALPTVVAQAGSGQPSESRRRYPMPPGAVSRDRFASHCTACQLCVTACPTHVLQPAFMENGITGIMQPYMRFRVESFCNFECRKCLEICPNDALVPLSLDEKKLTRVGEAVFKRGKCIVVTENQDCGACAEHCPTGAVHMVPYEGTLTIPVVEPEYCIGCGGCESICPVKPEPAITVAGNDRQEQALPPKKDEFKAGDTSDFGF